MSEEKELLRGRMREAELKVLLFSRRRQQQQPHKQQKEHRDVQQRLPKQHGQPAPQQQQCLPADDGMGTLATATAAALRWPAAASSAASAVSSVDGWLWCHGAGTTTSALSSISAREPPRRRVSVPGADFEATANGMGLKRKACERQTTLASAASVAPLRRRWGAGAPQEATARRTPRHDACAPLRTIAAAGASSSSSTAGGGAPVVTSLDFKRQRMADAARAAKGKMLCSFFCRHGRCDGRAGAECQFEHDPDRVAICQDYLHGTCDPDRDPPCPLSHAPSAENMPVCRLFARGLCVDSDCAFSHVHLGVSAPICAAFARCGYCANGAMCQKRHEMVCAAQTNERAGCALGERCKLGRPGPRKAGVLPRAE